MALIKCPKCNTDVSETAAKCPQCGRVVNVAEIKKIHKSRKVRKILIIVFGPFVLLILLLYGIDFVNYRNCVYEDYNRKDCMKNYLQGTGPKDKADEFCDMILRVKKDICKM